MPRRDAKDFFGWAASLDNNNAQNEYYLTDVPALAQKDGVGLRGRRSPMRWTSWA